eukprot:CAMPEP_0205946220 /NCGR_PEP_ID=MMETSP1325-20131115/68560_1 /ASSEMBLY_ACC=CAM_ASM_000708 /TAXON_ID=236786 /ORGANISM="Florenciella sp., Strain RCC1007" /LENGTH=42 /DNA_ID= /DNA_START= /DNA_END= /DNA_ORIENTATION=
MFGGGVIAESHKRMNIGNGAAAATDSDGDNDGDDGGADGALF